MTMNRAELEEMLVSMKAARAEGSRLFRRSGNPAVKARARSMWAEADDNVRWINQQLYKMERAEQEKVLDAQP